jgi:hypothetical protein
VFMHNARALKLFDMKVIFFLPKHATIAKPSAK